MLAQVRGSVRDRALGAQVVRPAMRVSKAEAWLREPRIEWSEGGR